LTSCKKKERERESIELAEICS